MSAPGEIPIGEERRLSALGGQQAPGAPGTRWILAAGAQTLYRALHGLSYAFFLLQPERALLADINRDLVEVFEAVRRHPVSVSTTLQALPIGKRAYYKLRALDPTTLNRTGAPLDSYSSIDSV